jgi:hypothetical protein
MSSEPIVAVGLLTRRDLDVLGSGFRRAYPVNLDADFSGLIEMIDQAEERARQARLSRA